MKDELPIKSILFIAYFYPPVAGRGLPGVQRISRFLRYIDIPDLHVLTLKPGCYPEYMAINSGNTAPIVKEKVHRTGTFDIFRLLIRVRNSIRWANGKIRGHERSRNMNAEPYGHNGKPQETSAIKDLLSTLITYPDFASPWLIPAIMKGLSAIRKNGIEAIFATGMPWTSLIVGYCLKVLTGKKLIVDFRDPWVNNPFLQRNALSRYLDSKFESLVVNKADLVIANTESLGRQMASRYKNIGNRLMVLPNGYDRKDFQNIPRFSFPENQLTITHAGLLYLKRDPMSFFDALERIKRDCPEVAAMIHFYQIGGADLTYDVREICAAKRISENVTILDYMKHEDCLGYLAASDVLLIIQPDTKTQIPSKLYEYIYLGKPVLAIAEKDGDLASLISEHNFGRVFDPGECNLLADYLYQLAAKKAKKEITNPDYTSMSLFDARNLLTEFKQRLCNL
jgi:glycosyltransferase involved in cell wall biosynthesis